ncbi:MAG: hypothetical protein N3A71_03355 [Candidatus Dojkabacteria bacterium]|nr:hypothetical protein [Candidatus Dojkabacteria bacterium]
MILSEMGKIVVNEWIKTPEIRKYVKLGEWVIMPNHFHAIVILNNEYDDYNNDNDDNGDGNGNGDDVETHCYASLRNKNASLQNNNAPLQNDHASLQNDHASQHNGNASLQNNNNNAFSNHNNDNASLYNCNEYKNKFGPQSKNLSAIVRGFKGAATKQIHLLGFSNFSWQSRFYEHIIRNEKEYYRIAEYIINNPLNWKTDDYFII